MVLHSKSIFSLLSSYFDTIDTDRARGSRIDDHTRHHNRIHARTRRRRRHKSPTLTTTPSHRYRPQPLLGVVMLLATSFLLVEGISGSASYTVPISKSQTVSIQSHDRSLYDNDTMPKIEDAAWGGMCNNWVNQPNHLYYHVVYGLFLFGFLAPGNHCGWIWIRSAVAVGSIMMLYSAWFYECDQEKVVWAVLFFVINFIYLTLSLIKLRPVKFDKEIEAVYMNLFEPLHVSRLRFRKMLQCMKLVRALKYQEVYAQEKVTKVDSLSLVLSGKLVVSQNQKALHIVFPHQFLDSPEWFGVSTDDYFQVSIVAMEESRVLIWHRDKLKLSIMEDPFLQTVVDHILGRDVVKKLMQVTQVNETMAQSNGFIISEVDEEDKPMLITNNHINHVNGKTKPENTSPAGLTALINRQLQAADVNAWRLGRIEEADHETPV